MMIFNGAKLGGATGAMAALVFWSRSLKKSRKVSKSLEKSPKSRKVSKVLKSKSRILEVAPVVSTFVWR